MSKERGAHRPGELRLVGMPSVTNHDCSAKIHAEIDYSQEHGHPETTAPGETRSFQRILWVRDGWSREHAELVLVVDLERIMERLAWKAARAKSGKATLAAGAIRCRVTSRKTLEPMPAAEQCVVTTPHGTRCAEPAAERGLCADHYRAATVSAPEPLPCGHVAELDANGDCTTCAEAAEADRCRGCGHVVEGSAGECADCFPEVAR